MHCYCLYNSGSLADRARLLSISSVHASSWQQVVPSPRQGCDMATSEMQWGIKWWLGLPLTPEIGVCAYCPDKVRMHTMLLLANLDEMKWRATMLCAKLFLIFDFCKRGLLNPKLKAGAGLSHERRLTRPADILIPSWSNSNKPAAIDVSITSPLKSNILSEAGVVAGGKANRKEKANMQWYDLLRIGMEVCTISGGDVWCLGKNCRPVFWGTRITTCGSKPFLKDNNVE